MVQNSTLLLGIEFMKALLRHAVHEKVVANLGVGIFALTVRLSDALGKNTRVFRVKLQVYAEELNKVSCSVPVTRVLFSFLVVAVDQHGFPSTESIVIDAKSFAWNGTEVPIRLLTISYPFSWLTTVIFGVIKSLEGQPILLKFYLILIINSLITKLI